MPVPNDGTTALPQDSANLSHDGLYDSALNGGGGGYKRAAGFTKDGTSAYTVIVRKDGSDVGPVTAVDGAMVTIGSISDAAWSGVGNGSVIGLLKRLISLLPGSLGTHGALQIEGVASGTAVTVTAADGQLAIRPSRGTYTNRSGSITTGGASQQIMAANLARNHWILQNTSTGDLWFNWTSAATIGQPSILLPAGGSYEPPPHFISTEAITLIGAVTGQTFSAKEG